MKKTQTFWRQPTKQVQLQWTTGILKWKLQTKIFLIVAIL